MLSANRLHTAIFGVDTESVCVIMPYVRTVFKYCEKPSKQRDGTDELWGLLAIDAAASRART